MDFPFGREPPIFTAYFAFAIIFAVLFFGQLVLALLTGIKKPRGDAFGMVTEQGVELLRLHRTRFTFLMTLMLMSLIIMYSLLATSLFYTSSITYTVNLTQDIINRFRTVGMASSCSFEIRNLLLFAVLVAVLDSGIKVSQLRHFSSTAKGIQGGTNVNIIVMSCLVGFLAILTVGLITVLNEVNAETEQPVYTFVSSAKIVADIWSEFGLFQARIFIDVVLTIYYTVVAILMWRKKRMVAHEPNEADHNYSFRALERIVKYVCPLLILSTIHMIITDVLERPIITTIVVNNQTSLSYGFASNFIAGVIAILLNLALISVGYVL
ncbi:hypothetical protein JOM56_001009 [Amanita muscaria]